MQVVINTEKGTPTSIFERFRHVETDDLQPEEVLRTNNTSSCGILEIQEQEMVS